MITLKRKHPETPAEYCFNTKVTMRSSTPPLRRTTLLGVPLSTRTRRPQLEFRAVNGLCGIRHAAYPRLLAQHKKFLSQTCGKRRQH